MSATKTRLALANAQKVANRLLHTLAPGCVRITVAGSIRRGKDTVGDIEIVCIPIVTEWETPAQLDLFGGQTAPAQQFRVNKLDGVLADLLAKKQILREPPTPDLRPAWGERMKKFWLPMGTAFGWAQVDLFIADPSNWGAILTIRTGPADFSQALVTHIKRNTPYQQQGGYLVRQAGKIIPVPDERDYFRLAGVDWIEPQERTVAALQQAVARWQRRTLRRDAQPGTVPYTTDQDVRAAIRARLEAKIA